MKRWIVAASFLGLLPASIAAAQPCKQTTGKLTVQFKPDASLYEVGMWLTSFTCKNVVFGADVPKHATKLNLIVSSAPMTPKQAIQLFVDAVESTGLVVKQKPETFVISLGPKLPRSCPDLAVDTISGTPARPDLTTPAPDPDAQALQELVDKNTRKIDDTHFEIKEALIDKILTNPMAVMKGARIVPAMKDGKPAGIKLYAIRPS